MKMTKVVRIGNTLYIAIPKELSERFNISKKAIAYVKDVLFNEEGDLVFLYVIKRLDGKQ